MAKKVVVDKKAVAILDHNDGGAGQVDSWFEAATGLRVACFINDAESFNLDVAEQHRKRICKRTDFPENGRFKGRPFIVSTNWIEELKKRGINKVLPMSGPNRTRLKHVEMCLANGIELVSAIHPTAVIMPQATIEPGVWINANVYIGYKTEVQSGALIETGVILEHHNIVERCVEIFPGAITAGFVTMRKCSVVNLGAKILNKVEIGEDAIVSAGTLVTSSIPPRVSSGDDKVINRR